MNTKQIVKVSSLFTLILALMVTTVVAVAAVMKKDNSVDKAQTTTWHYLGGNSESEILNASNWVKDEDGAAHPQCGQAEDLPCTVNQAPEDEVDFQTYLTNRGASGIMEDSSTKRPFVAP